MANVEVIATMSYNRCPEALFIPPYFKNSNEKIHHEQPAHHSGKTAFKTNNNKRCNSLRKVNVFCQETFLYKDIYIHINTQICI